MLEQETAKNHQLSLEINNLKNENKELQRKFLESLKGIEEFKNDALKAKQEVIEKESIIQRLSNEQGKSLDNSRKSGPNKLDGSRQSQSLGKSSATIDPQIVDLLKKSIESRRQIPNVRGKSVNGLNEDLLRRAKT